MNKIHYSETIIIWICLKEWDLVHKDNLVRSLVNQTWVDLNNKKLLKACQSYRKIN